LSVWKMIDTSIWTIPLFLFTWLMYAIVFMLQVSKLEPTTARLQVLAVRAAFCLPFYGFFIWLSIVEPRAYTIFLIFITFVEGFAFYNYASLIITDCGGPNRFVELLKGSGRSLLCCGSCCPKDFVVYYKRATWAIWHFWWTRTVLAVLVCICSFSHTPAGKALQALFSVTGAVIVLYAIVAFVLMYENVYKETMNVNGLSKFLLVKLSVGAIVLQGLIAEFLVTSNKAPYTDDDTYTVNEKTIRGYCAIVLLEFVVLALFMVWSYGSKITAPASKEVAIPKEDTKSCCGFFFQVFCKGFDCLGTITYLDGLSDNNKNANFNTV